MPNKQVVVLLTVATSKTSTSTKKAPVNTLTAKQFVSDLLQQPAADNSKFYRGDNKQNKIAGIRMAAIFLLARQYMQMPLAEVEKLLSGSFYEARMGAVSIMDFKARDKKTTAEVKEQLYNLYINNHHYINNWDLVDRSAPFVVGGYLFDKDRKPLYKLARSKDIWERRTAIVATYYFIRQDDVADTFKIAALLVDDKEDLINKAVGSWVREAGKRDKKLLLDFLNKHAATMPRVTLRYAIEKLDKKEKERFMNMATNA